MPAWPQSGRERRPGRFCPTQTAAPVYRSRTPPLEHALHDPPYGCAPSPLGAPPCQQCSRLFQSLRHHRRGGGLLLLVPGRPRSLQLSLGRRTCGSRDTESVDDRAGSLRVVYGEPSCAVGRTPTNRSSSHVPFWGVNQDLATTASVWAGRQISRPMQWRRRRHRWRDGWVEVLDAWVEEVGVAGRSGWRIPDTPIRTVERLR